LDPDPLVRGTSGYGDPDPHQNVTAGSPTLIFQMTFFVLKGTVLRDFLLLVFFLNQFPPPLIIPLGPFRIFSKIRGDIRSSRFATGVNDTGGK
jgi:hypothetical protein